MTYQDQMGQNEIKLLQPQDVLVRNITQILVRQFAKETSGKIVCSFHSKSLLVGSTSPGRMWVKGGQNGDTVL